MSKKLSALILLLALVLSACRGETPAATATPAPTDTPPPPTSSLTPPPQVTETSATPVTDTPAARPTNDPNCTNKASFVADVTIPDNTVINAGETFTKTWRISNTGTCIWANDYVLTYYSENRMGAQDVPLGLTYPGQTLDISVQLTAPTSPGTYRGNFVIKNPQGLIISIDEDSRLWLIIKVENTAAPTSAATVTAGPSPTAGASPTTAAGVTPPAGSGAGTASCSFTTDVFKLTDAIAAINAYRAQNNLPAYTVNTLLVRAAQRHANDMACNNFFTHTGTDGSTPQTRVADTGYAASSVSENVYGSNPPLDGAGVINWWKTDTTDPRHNQNLLSTTYTEIGVGYAFYNGYGYYVLVLAKP